MANKKQTNPARRFLQWARKTHFPETEFVNLHTIGHDELKEYMLRKMDEMMCVDYEDPSETPLEIYSLYKEYQEKGDPAELLKRKLQDAPSGIKKFLQRLNEKNPMQLCTLIWEDPRKLKIRKTCPIAQEELLKQLTRIELEQVSFLKLYTMLFEYLSEGMYHFPLHLLLPGVTSDDVAAEAGNSILSTWFYRDGSMLSEFIASTPYRRVAAAMSHLMLVVTTIAAMAVDKQHETDEEISAKCEKLIDFLDQGDADWMRFKSGWFPANRYVARVHSMLHMAELEYGLNDIMKLYRP